MTTGSLPLFQNVRATTASVEAVVDDLKTAIDAAGLWVLHEKIDPQALLRRDGIEPARQLLFFHPRYMSRLLDADPAAVLEAPLKFAVVTDSGRAVVRWMDALQGFSRYGIPALHTLGAEPADICNAIAADAVEAES